MPAGFFMVRVFPGLDAGTRLYIPVPMILWSVDAISVDIHSSPNGFVINWCNHSWYSVFTNYGSYHSSRNVIFFFKENWGVSHISKHLDVILFCCGTLIMKFEVPTIKITFGCLTILYHYSVWHDVSILSSCYHDK